MKLYKILADLRQKLTEYFIEQELRTLCFDLGVKYDELPGSTIGTKAEGLVTHLYQCGRIHELIGLCCTQRPNIPWTEVMDQLYAEARQAEVNMDWAQAVSLYKELFAVDKEYKDTAHRLAEAEKQKKLAELYDKARQAEVDKDWAQAIDLYEQIHAVDEEYKDIAHKLAEVKKQKKMAELYVEARQAEASREWTQAISLYKKIVAVDKEYKCH